MIRGETVAVRHVTGTATDRLNVEVPVYGEPVDVGNVLVVPSTMGEADHLRPDGVRIAYTLHFPRGYPQSLRGARVTVRGDECRVVGDPKPYTEANVRGPWTMPVEVAMSDG